jgi:ribosomal protein S18 acetylase RimI-like enzyme
MKEENDTNTLINKKKKKMRVFSDAFPSNKQGDKYKMPCYSEVHKILTNYQIQEKNIYYRKLSREDIDEVKNLHKEWFPIDYGEEYFEKIFNALENKNENGIMFYTLGAVILINNMECILGAVICEMKTDAEFIRHAGKHSYRKVSFSIFDEVSLSGETYQFAYIMTIGVVDECRGLNIGSKLLNKMINYFTSYHPNCLGIYLHVVEYNKVAINFYRKNKFFEANGLRNYYHINGDVYDAVVFAKLFQPEERRQNKSFLMNLFENLIIKPFKLILFCLSCGLGCRCFKKKYKII